MNRFHEIKEVASVGASKPSLLTYLNQSRVLMNAIPLSVMNYTC